MVMLWLEVTAVVVIVNVVLLCPPATVTTAGTWAAALLEATCTSTPPDGAAPLKPILPVTDSPPTTVAELSVRLWRVGVTGAG
jgi:hypothetical protein